MKKILFATLILLVLFTGIALAKEAKQVIDPPLCKPESNSQCNILYLPIVTIDRCPEGLDWINGYCSVIPEPPPEPPNLPLEVHPPDLAPLGCASQVTLDWSELQTKPIMWSMTHRVNSISKDNCGMEITYTVKGNLVTRLYTGEGLVTYPDGASIDNHKWIGDNGEITWISKGIAPDGEGLTRGTIFNK